MKKNICFLIVILLCIGMFSLSGCAVPPGTNFNPTAENTPAESENEETVEDDFLYMEELSKQTFSNGTKICYYKETVTDVVYISFSNHQEGKHITALLDPNTGLPITYTRYVELHEGVPEIEEDVVEQQE